MNTLSAIVHGESGVGKSWLLMTMPGPRLILDVEGRTKFTPTEKVLWDPRQAPPTVDPDTTVVVKIKDFATLELTMQWLQSGQHPFRSAGIDSITELQKRAMDAIAGTNQPDQQDWGALLRKGEKTVRDFRDLTDHATNPLDLVVIVAGTMLKDGKQRPMLQGQIALNVPYYLDVNAYYAVGVHPETGEIVRFLQIQPIGAIVAKDGTDILTRQYGAFVYNPDFCEIMAVLNGKEVA